MKTPLITIIIATYNAEAFLERTLKSLLNQSYTNYELILIDACSKDKTLQIINSYLKEFDIVRFISEPDDGIYDAWNKGVLISSGEWIAFLGAGDEYYPNALKIYVDSLNNISILDLDYISSKIEVVNKDGVLLYTRGSAWKWSKYRKFMNVAHVGSLHSSSFFKKNGLFNVDYKITGDYELLMRPKANLRAAYINLITAKMLNGGVSTSSNVLREYLKVKTETAGISRFVAYFDYCLAYIKLLSKNILAKFGIYFTIRG